MFGLQKEDEEFDAEVREHLELLTDRFMGRGMQRKEAVRAARQQFGNRTRVIERHREGGMVLWMANLSRDMRYAARQLWSNPAFTVVMVLTLGLSIGANSAIFSVVDSVLLKSLPYPEPERIVRVFLSGRAFPRFSLNPFDFRDYRQRSKSFESVAAYVRADAQLLDGGEAVRLNGFGVTAGYFRVLGLKPELGREFDETAEVPGSGSQVILSDRLWRTRFGASGQIVGQKVTLDMQPYTVVGVMPPGTQHPGNEYHALAYGESVDVWRPFTFEGNPAHRGSHFLDGIGRLKPGITTEQAQAELNSVMAQMAKEHPADEGWQMLVVPLFVEIVGTSRRILLVLLGAVGMVLLIACANAANLLLSRASARRREVAVRLALGASRGRLIRQLLTESLLISLLGGGLALVIAVSAMKSLLSLLPLDFPRVHEIQVSVPVFVFTLLVSIATGVLFGLAPALQASRTDPKTGLQQGSRGGVGERSRLRNVLVISEVSLACVLLIGAGLMLRSLLNLIHLDPGFEQQHLLTASLTFPKAHYKDDTSIIRFDDQLVATVGAMSGVQFAGAGSDLPWTGYDENAGFNIEGKRTAPHEEFHARYHMASPDYFRALGIPLLQGRFYTVNDNKDAPQGVIINQAMADRYWPHEDAVGKRITYSNTPKDKDWITVVGVVGNVKDKPNSAGAEPAMWWSMDQNPSESMSLVVRSETNPQLLTDAVRSAVKRLDPTLAVADIRVMDEIVNASVASPRVAFVLVGLFAGLAMVLAAIGTYGVIAYSVSQRTSEFGLRLALGAQREDVLRMVMVQAANLVVGGALLGLVLALTLSRVVKSLIYEVSPTDPMTFAIVGLLVIGAAAIACYIPARRATKVDPMIALRAE
jgi:predicted permease